MKLSTSVALAAALLLSVAQVRADDIGSTVKKGGEQFQRDAREFGHRVKDVSEDVQSKMLSGATQTITGPSGETIILVGDVTGEAADAIASQYAGTQDALQCVSKDWLNPFKDSGCAVQYGGRTLLLSINVAGDGTRTLVVASADIMSDVFNGFAQMFDSAADHTGRMSNPVGALFVLSYHLTEASETVLRFALVDVAARTVEVLTDSGASIVSAPIDVAYDIVTLRWTHAGVKLINLPLKLANKVLNIPIRLIFGSHHKDLLLKSVSPMGRLINKTIGVSNERANELNQQTIGSDT